MIHVIKVRNFKSLASVDVAFERFTVFVGANGSGKSSLLAAIECFAEALTLEPSGVFRNERDPETLYTREGDGELEIALEVGGRWLSLFACPSEAVPRQPNGQDQIHWRLRHDPVDMRVHFARELSPISFLRLDPRLLAKASYSADNIPTMAETGEGLASVLADAALSRPEVFADIKAKLRELLPTVRDIRLQRERVLKQESEVVRFGEEGITRHFERPYQGYALVFDFEHAQGIPAHAVSEGTLLLLGMLTALLGQQPPKVILIDDLERALHPLAQKRMVGVINQILEKFPDLQVIATTHSSHLLNYLEHKQIRLMALDDQGHSHCGELKDHPKYEKWKEEFYPGEMWSAFGDRWLVEPEVASK